ncbi:hypothetical protein OCU04_000271 [Sclerotinia nivalis]|uniref:Inositol oxygenase n=1 Tax=Sclerotinia nivalis TaxID=352851 RepID=A0A9X0DQ56_9HELO|nr:hypothetical protein OCU04_000271 [Sclerotinia nivalis]
MSSNVAVEVQRPINGFGGQELERTSDNIDQVNLLAAQLRESKDPQKKVLFRQYKSAEDSVKEFYIKQHTNQTYDFNIRVRQNVKDREPVWMTVWQAIELLNTYTDDSDPDTQLSQIEHLLQTAEAMRRDGRPRWMILTGLIHDLGKLLSFFGAADQWEVVGDTFPVGCAFDEDIVFSETFENNPDYHNPKYNTKYGIYSPNCGLDNVMMSYGHDEYLYHVAKTWSTLPQEALDMIRYHSFYSMHRDGKYKHLMNEEDEKRLAAVKMFNPYDLYSKADAPPNVEELKPYYLELIKEFFPQEVIAW